MSWAEAQAAPICVSLAERTDRRICFDIRDAASEGKRETEEVRRLSAACVAAALSTVARRAHMLTRKISL